MKIDLSHSKNPALGWDITVKAAADAGEKISSATVIVNGGTIFQGSLNNLSSWNRTFSQKGYYPGENTVRVSMMNDKDEETSNEDSWE